MRDPGQKGEDSVQTRQGDNITILALVHVVPLICARERPTGLSI